MLAIYEYLDLNTSYCITQLASKCTCYAPNYVSQPLAL